jgi:hypothetical protein
VIATLRDFVGHRGYDASQAAGGEDAIAAMTTSDLSAFERSQHDEGQWR